MQEEIDYLVNERVTKLVREIHSQENSKFEKLQQKFQNCSVSKEPESYSLEKDNERLKTENSMLKQTLEDLKSREISYKALLPTAVSNQTHTEKVLYLQRCTKYNLILACNRKISYCPSTKN